MRSETPAEEASSSGTILRLGALAGLLTAYAQLVYLGHRRFVRHILTFQGEDVVFMKPVAELAFFVLCGLALVATGRLRGRPMAPAWAAGAYTFLGTLSLMLMFPPIHRAAALFLAAGLGVQTGRWLRGKGDSLDRLSRRALGPLAAIPIVAAAAIPGARALAERRGLAREPAEPGSPNVLLFVLDTVRSRNLGFYGYSRPTTPFLGRWAEGGARFEHCLAPTSWTLPSHVAMFTGRLPHEQSSDWLLPLDDRWPTLAEALGARGYATAGFVANVVYCGRESGLARGFQRYEDHPLTPGQLAKSSLMVKELAGNRLDLARKDAREINRDFLAWLDGQSGRPFFAFLNYYDAHTPYAAPEPYESLFVPPGGRGLPEPEQRREARQDWTRGELQPAVDSYDGAIAYLDSQVGALLRELERRGLLADTLVVLTSDHGEEFGEHGRVNHGISLYRPAVEVPLVLVHPGGVPAGHVVSTPVSLRDLPATIMDIVSGDGSVFPGRSLTRFWRDGAVGADRVEPVPCELTLASGVPTWYPSGKGPMSSVTAEGLRLIRNGDGREELYDFARDPLELEDLAAAPHLAPALGRLREAVPRDPGRRRHGGGDLRGAVRRRLEDPGR